MLPSEQTHLEVRKRDRVAVVIRSNLSAKQK